MPRMILNQIFQNTQNGDKHNIHHGHLCLVRRNPLELDSQRPGGEGGRERERCEVTLLNTENVPWLRGSWWWEAEAWHEGV